MIVAIYANSTTIVTAQEYRMVGCWDYEGPMGRVLALYRELLLYICTLCNTDLVMAPVEGN